MTDPLIPVGFDYARAILDIRREMTYEQIAEVIGLPDKQSVSRIVAGTIPHHPQGEAIWALYRELFNTNPPMPEANAKGVSEVALARRHNRILAV